MINAIMENAIQCPVDFVAVNENQVRLTAAGVLISAIAYLLTGGVLIIAFLILDFSLRAFHAGRFSPLNWLSRSVVKQFSISNRPIDRAPKRFAAIIGTILTLAILSLDLLHYSTGAIVLAFVLVTFSFLESVLGFCAGCYGYTFYKKIFSKSSSPQTT
jgi:hypothetical protein